MSMNEVGGADVGPDEFVMIAGPDGEPVRMAITRLLTADIVRLSIDRPKQGWAYAVRFARLANSLAYTNRLLTAEIEALRRVPESADVAPRPSLDARPFEALPPGG